MLSLILACIQGRCIKTCGQKCLHEDGQWTAAKKRAKPLMLTLVIWACMYEEQNSPLNRVYLLNINTGEKNGMCGEKNQDCLASLNVLEVIDSIFMFKQPKCCIKMVDVVMRCPTSFLFFLNKKIVSQMLHCLVKQETFLI